MKYLKTFEEFSADSVMENAALKQAAAEVGAEMLKKKLSEAAYEMYKEAMKVDGDESDMTASDSLKEAMYENAAVLKQVATDIAIDKAKEKMAEASHGEEVNENPAIAMAAASMLKEMYESLSEACDKHLKEGFPNLAKKAGVTGAAADMAGMPRGTGLDAD